MVLCSNHVPDGFPGKNSKSIPPDESTAKISMVFQFGSTVPFTEIRELPLEKQVENSPIGDTILVLQHLKSFRNAINHVKTETTGKTPYKDSPKWSEQMKSSDCLEHYFMYISTIKKQRTYQDIGDKDESGNLITILPGNFIHVLKKNIEVYLKFHPPAVRTIWKDRLSEKMIQYYGLNNKSSGENEVWATHNLHHEHALLLDAFKHLVCRNTYTSIALEWNLMSEGIDSDVFCKEELLLLSKWLDIECLTNGSYKLDLIVQMPLMLRNSTSVFICKLWKENTTPEIQPTSFEKKKMKCLMTDIVIEGNKNMAYCKGKKEEFEESTHYNNFGKTNENTKRKNTEDMHHINMAFAWVMVWACLAMVFHQERSFKKHTSKSEIKQDINYRHRLLKRRKQHVLSVIDIARRTELQHNCKKVDIAYLYILLKLLYFSKNDFCVEDDHAYTDNCLDKTNADADMQNERCDIEEISEFDGDDSQIKLKSEYLDYLDDKDCYIGASCPCLACQFTFVDCYLSNDVPDLTLTEFDEISDEKDTELEEISDDAYTELDDIYSVCSTEEIPSLIAKRKEKKLCDCLIHRNRDICSCLNEKIIWNRLEGELSSTPLYQDYNESDMERMPDEFMYDQIKAQKAESEISDFDKEDNEFASVNNDIGINEDSLSIETQPTFTSSYINRNIEDVECECVHHRIESSENIKFVSPRTDINEHVGGRKNTAGDSGFFSLLENELPSEEEDLLLQKEKQEGNGKRKFLDEIINYKTQKTHQDLVVCPVARKLPDCQLATRNDQHSSQASDIESDDPGFNVGNRRYDLENHEDNRNDTRDLLDGPTKNDINSGPQSSKSVPEKDDEPDGLVSIEESNVPSSSSANMLGMAVGGHDGQGSTGATSSTVNTSISTAYQLRLEAQNNPTFSANSLGSYFRECVAGKEFTFEQVICYEWMRVKTFEDFPVRIPVSSLTLANEGFIYLGTEDRVKCFSCGMEYYGFKRWDNPREIHRQRSPDCRMVCGIESTNIPVRAQDQHRPALTNGIGVSQRNALENVVVQNNVATSQNGLVQPSAVQSALNNTADSRMEYHSRQPNTTLQQSIVSTDQASLSTTGHNNSQRPADVLERPARQPIGGGDRAEELGITIERPKYPAYAQLSVRISTFQGWPGYLDQAPRDMALAGFFYAGYNDYCRCFFCGGGLRNWDAGDDPWVEHARWFSKCAFVRQNRGHRFVEIIVKRQAEMQASGNASGSAKNQTAVTTNMPETETQAPTPATFESLPVAANVNVDPAVASVREMGYTDEIVQRAIDIMKRNNPGKEKIEATELLEVVFSIDDNELGSNTAVNSENTQLVSGSQSRQQNLQMSTSSVERQTNQRIIQAQPANPPESSIPSLPSLSVSSLENKTTEAGAQEGALAATAHSKVSDAEIRSLQEENTQLKEQVMCKICMDKNVSIAFLPCGHLACCIDCAPAMRKCPMCRVYIKGTVKTYLA
ncbi:uncharacterized protein LOC143049569 [Mytilus galloprovincialis]|uniref:uncharacterized protein LOC143049569 n=1 Tax=Mytilus galloprovincialis TaxID=29158 RepID=UPI003F7C4B3E